MTTEQQLKLMAELARDHVSFEDIEDMNEAVRKYEDMFKLKGKILLFLKELKKHSCVYNGVSFCKRSSWAKFFKVSERTIKRWLDKLSKLGIIKDIPAFEPSGRQMWNHVVIQPLPVEEKVEEKQADVIPSGDNVSSLKNKSLKQNIKRLSNRIEDTPVEIPSFIPQTWAKKVMMHFNSIEMLDTLYKRVKSLAKKSGLFVNNMIPEDFILEAYKATVWFYKQPGRVWRKGKTDDVFVGYFYKTLKQRLDDRAKELHRPRTKNDAPEHVPAIPILKGLFN